MKAAAPHRIDHRLERLVYFSDAVFAIAITLLALDIHLPMSSPAQTNADWLQVFLALIPQLAAFLLSFAVVGAFWSAHHGLMAMLEGFDQRLVWPNLLFLMFITLLPFVTRLIGIGSGAAAPFMVYSGVLLGCGLAKALIVRLALRDHLLRRDIAPAQIAREARQSWVMPLVALTAMLLALVAPAWNNLAMLLLPVAKRLPPFR